MATIQQLYDLLRTAGLPRIACLAFLGNWERESGNEPNRLQGDYSSFRTSSKQYTAGIMDGSISRQQFMTDQKGYGLAQWTHHNFDTGRGRKQALYDYWKQSGMAIDSPALQVSFAMKELKEDFPGLYKELLQISDLYTAVSKICYIFENPAVKNVQERYRAAQEIAQLVEDSPQERSTSMKTGTGLAEYAIAQLGKPYWWGTYGQTANDSLLARKRAQYPDYYQANDFQSQFGEKVHDCVGLIKGYRWCDTPDGEPEYEATQDVAVSGLYTQCNKKGTLSSMPDIPGVCVFQADMGHVGVYIGNGYVVEAMGHAYGVVKTQLHNRNWSIWGMPSWINYDEEAQSEQSDEESTPQPTQPSTPAQQFKTMKTDLPLLKMGAKGIPVKKLQHLLLLEESSRKLIESSGGADGEYGQGTKDAVIAYQKSKNLLVDGETGSEVWESLITT